MPALYQNDITFCRRGQDRYGATCPRGVKQVAIVGRRRSCTGLRGRPPPVAQRVAMSFVAEGELRCTAFFGEQAPDGAEPGSTVGCPLQDVGEAPDRCRCSGRRRRRSGGRRRRLPCPWSPTTGEVVPPSVLRNHEIIMPVGQSAHRAVTGTGKRAQLATLTSWGSARSSKGGRPSCAVTRTGFERAGKVSQTCRGHGQVDISLGQDGGARYGHAGPMGGDQGGAGRTGTDSSPRSYSSAASRKFGARAGHVVQVCQARAQRPPGEAAVSRVGGGTPVAAWCGHVVTVVNIGEDGASPRPTRRRRLGCPGAP